MVPSHGYDPNCDQYALPIDPYLASRPPINWNAQLFAKLFDASLTAKEIEDSEYHTIYRAILVDLRRVPNLAPSDKRQLIRDFADIEELMQCEGTREKVRSMLRTMLFEIQAHSSDGSTALNGLSTVAVLNTQKSQVEQQVKLPQEQQRKKIFGVF